MGITLGVLIILFVSEIAFTAYCLMTRSNQVRVRSFSRIGLLVVFIVATLISILHWGIRWYGLGILLLLWAALGAWRLWRPQGESKSFAPFWSVLGTIGRLLLIVIVLIPAIILPQFTLPPSTGAHQVASMTYTYTDTSRIETFTTTGAYRKVNVGCWYPADGNEKYPLLLFSHGAFGMKGGNLSTFMNLASNGYIACSIDHPYHSLFTVDTAGQRTLGDAGYVQDVLNWDNDKFDRPTSLAMVKTWMQLRVEDMQFVLNTLQAQAQNPGDDPVYQRIDPQHIGLFGHSLGGATSAAIARERDDIDAVIVMDGTLFGEYLGYEEETDTYTIQDAIFPVPILVIATDPLNQSISAANDPEGQNPINRIVTKSPNAYKLHITGHHLNVTDLPIISPLMASLIIAAAPDNGGTAVDPYTTMEEVNQTVLEFFNAYLKGEGSFTTAQMP